MRGHPDVTVVSIYIKKRLLLRKLCHRFLIQILVFYKKKKKKFKEKKLIKLLIF